MGKWESQMKYVKYYGLLQMIILKDDLFMKKIDYYVYIYINIISFLFLRLFL